MKPSKVSLVQVKDYQQEHLNSGLKKGLNLLGGIQHIINPHSRVFVKINHLSPPSPPEKAIVTHPSFTREVLGILKSLSCHITVGDDIQYKGKDRFHTSGYQKICDEMEVELINLKEAGFRKIKCNGKHLKSIYISPPILESDHVINLPKLKTHSFTIFTGAVKNMYGVIPYGLRLQYHKQFSLPSEFSEMLVDIYSCVPPCLSIMDGINSMEGEGPSSGNPRKTNVILISEDGVALDAVASQIVGLDPISVYSTQDAHQRGVGVGDLKKIQILGEEISRIKTRDFKHSAVAVGIIQRRIPQILHSFIQNQLTFIPEVIPKKCTSCMECIDICPTAAAQIVNGKAWIEQNKCIHCMCCHEVCQFHAIKLKNQPMGLLIRKASHWKQKISRLLRFQRD
ncbi:MAG: DUF362 domain-containing protein [Candidatus Aminicenantes bacterium]|nr:DUF362 domain-containing protein [Candidatus Aminicenantes bacterium]